MPLEPRFSFEQDAQQLVIEIYLPGTSLRTTDIYVSDLLVKVNAAPYVLLLDLWAEVDDTTAAVKRLAATSLLQISLQKVKQEVWAELEFKGPKRERRERREASMDRKCQREAELRAKKQERRYAEEKQTLRAQMAVDDANRQLLSDLKAEEKEREERELYESFRELQAKNAVATPSSTKKDTSRDIYRGNQCEAGERAVAIHPIIHSTSKPSVEKKKKTVTFASLPEMSKSNQEEEMMEPEILELNEDGTFDVSTIRPASKTEGNNQEEENGIPEVIDSDVNTQDENGEEEEEGFDTVELPPPRACVKSEIEFTPRVFPTPSRESKAAEEEDWLVKNRKHLASHKGLRRSSDYDISESDPVWLKAKGDDFFRAKDFRSAANAYSEAIGLLAMEATDQMTACLSNRAACHLQLAQFEECISDCSKALSYLPDTREGSEMRDLRSFRLKLKLFVRRGTAHCRLEQFTSAKADYGVAVTMDAQNEHLKDDFMQLMALEKAQELKLSADECVRADISDLEQAISLYSQSLELHPTSIACLSNRAACYLMMNEGEKCVNDCSIALTLLQRDVRGDSELLQGAGSLAFFSVGPPPGSVKRREWVVRTLVRRGTALRSIGELLKAKKDFEAAVELDPRNDALKLDLAQIKQQLEPDIKSYS